MGSATLKPKYDLKSDGRFCIDHYNRSKTFSNFFPGIAGLWGTPMWVFYVNRGQCIASFGVESKDRAIMEFQPANKAYRLTSLQGFRTFVKLKSGSQSYYWEPFQDHVKGTEYKKTKSLEITSHDLTLTETNHDLGITARVNYFTLPEEPYAALVRRVTFQNSGRKSYQMEVIDGLPAIVPYGLTDGLNKNISRTVEAWVKVGNMAKKAPYYQLVVEVSDRPQVTPIEEGNFFFSFDPLARKKSLLDPIIEAAHVFGESLDFLAPVHFMRDGFRIPKEQQADNRTPSAMSYTRFALNPKDERGIVSLFGYALSESQLNKMLRQATAKGFVEAKALRNKEIIDDIKNYSMTKSSSNEFDLYSSQNFLDNILRGGLPISLKTARGAVSLNVFSRKHGDLERDYNHFVVSPTYFSQGNGNYRDVNQNRRNDVWFNKDVKAGHLVAFLSLSQADGYNPLVVKGTGFAVKDRKQLEKMLLKYADAQDRPRLSKLLKSPFTPGDLLKFIMLKKIRLRVSPKVFLENLLEICEKTALADHGEGFWSDHWTYNLDLIESYLAVYPEDLKMLLVDSRDFTFYHNSSYVLPRENRYLLTDRGVRQYASVANGTLVKDDRLRMKKGEGDVYRTNLACKLLCLAANKCATLDPSGIGVEMEADKPNWYDALNGLPGLLGSSVSETFELKRLCLFLLEALDRCGIQDGASIPIFEELENFIEGLTHILSTEKDSLHFWDKANDLKEHYREYVRNGIHGTEIDIKVSEVRDFLKLVIAKTDRGIDAAKNSKGFLSTYFTHEVTLHEPLPQSKGDDADYIRPVKFKKRTLPLFLEGYVHALRVSRSAAEAKRLYEQVRKSGLFDKKLKMYKVCADLSGETEEIGRARIFPRGWLENESVWLHMEYKFMLELLRAGLTEEFYANFRSVLVPFLKPEQYGRSILENSSFLVSSAHEDASLYGRGFVARLSGSTAEFVHIWLLMNVGKEPFQSSKNGVLAFAPDPSLAGWLFTKKKQEIICGDPKGRPRRITLPRNTYAFKLLATTLLVYHNPRRVNTYGGQKPAIREIHLTYPNKNKAIKINSRTVNGVHAQDIRDGKIERIDIFFK